MEIKAVKFRKDGFYTQPFAFGGEEGMDKFDHNIRYRGSMQNYLIDTGTEVILVDTGFPADMPVEVPDENSRGFAEDEESARKATLTPQQWQQIFTESAEMGINFSLLAGGEPMMRKDILEAVAEVKDMIFPIFTGAAR